MKIFHLSDLHIGKQIAGYDIEEDQRYVFSQILEYMDAEKPDVVIIAGDIYDRALPSAKSVTLFDELLCEINKRGAVILVISGNHDSAERMAYGSRIMKNANVHIMGAYKGSCDRVIIEDEYGKVNFYLMPYVRPVDVMDYFDVAEGQNADYAWAVDHIIEEMHPDTAERNVLVAHLNITNRGENSRTDSESVIIGMVDNIDVKHLDAFDYVALGHLHRPQHIGRPEVRYCGTPMAYSISEAKDHKSISVVELSGKGDIKIRILPFKQLRGWVDFKGTMNEAMSLQKNDNYTRFLLTDEETVIDAIPRLRTIYERIIDVEFQTRAGEGDLDGIHDLSEIEDKSPLELFEEFYGRKHDGMEISDEKRKYIEDIIKEMEEVE